MSWDGKWIAFVIVVMVALVVAMVVVDAKERSDCAAKGGSYEKVGEQFVMAGKTPMMLDDYDCVGGLS